MNEELILVFPTIEYEMQAKELIKETIELDNNNPDKWAGFARLNEFEDYREWVQKVINSLDSTKLEPGRVSATTYFTVRKSDNKIVGIIDIRHALNDYLREFGGHIGYSIRPTERRNGYAKQMLKLMLEECKKYGLEKVLICCDKENLGSSKTILAGGGILENEVKDEVGLTASGIIQRYWINIK